MRVQSLVPNALTATLIGGFLLAACTDETPGALAGNWRAEVDTLADTITVRTVSGSEWGSARLVEDLRIGVADGADHLMFGSIHGLAVRSNGEILVYDGQATALRRFGPDGGYLGTISREGSGPGEYRNIAGFAVLPDDRLVVHDFGNQRFNLYSSDSAFIDNWILVVGAAARRPLHIHDGGSIYLHDQVVLGQQSAESPILVRLDDRGAPGDTTVIRLTERKTPSLVLRTPTGSRGTYIPFHAAPHWSVTPSGELVVVDGARYAIDVHRRDGKVLRLIRTVANVPVSAEEREAETDRITASFRRVTPTWSWDGEPIPEAKPPIEWLHTGQDGSLWVRTAQPGLGLPETERAPGERSWIRTPVVFDVFASDGRYRGEVRAPDGFQLSAYPVLGEEHVWAVVQDSTGVNFIARFRIERSGERSQ